MYSLGISFLSALLFGNGIAFAQEHFTTPNTFPSPNSTGAGGWEHALAKADEFLSRLNLTEKVSMVTGSSAGDCIGNIAPLDRLNFTGICLQDGPVGDRLADLASMFPAGVTIAATWDKELMMQRGYALGTEFKAKGAHVMLGPSAGALGRHPLGGRNWEGFSPDPYLSGAAMNATIVGIQEAGAQASAKHFVGNEQETQRTSVALADGTTLEAISSNIDDRTMHELYMWPFANAVKARVASVMCSYNRVNQTYACENSKALNGLLKEELGFQGYIVSDFFAVHSGVKSIEAGLDLNMPGSIDEASIPLGLSFFGANLTEAVQNGTIPESRLDDMVRRVLTPYFALTQDDGYPSVDPTSRLVLATTYGVQLPMTAPAARDVRGTHGELIRTLGAAGTVLLKNVNKTLPLSQPMNIGIFGNDAADVTAGLFYSDPDGGSDTGFDTGTLAVGGGSGAGRSTYIVSPLRAIQQRAAQYGGRVQYILSNDLLARGNFRAIYPTPDVCLVFVKAWSQEGRDRRSLANDWDGAAVVANVAARCPNTVVVNHAGGVTTMLPWADNANVTAVLNAYYPGQETGDAVADVLFGDVNPSGRLPHTIPKRAVDCDIPIVNLTGTAAANDSAAWQSDFAEGLLIDYRCFDARNVTPLYEFGFGLSYADFALAGRLDVVRASNASLSAFPPPQSAAREPGGNPALWEPVLRASVAVENTGDVAGATVVQLYLGMPADGSVPDGTPVRVLRGFEKVYLEPGESRDVAFALLRRDVSFWNVEAQEWEMPSGEVEVHVGFSSRDLRDKVGVRLL